MFRVYRFVSHNLKFKEIFRFLPVCKICRLKSAVSSVNLGFSHLNLICAGKKDAVY